MRSSSLSSWSSVVLLLALAACGDGTGGAGDTGIDAGRSMDDAASADDTGRDRADSQIELADAQRDADLERRDTDLSSIDADLAREDADLSSVDALFELPDAVLTLDAVITTDVTLGLDAALDCSAMDAMAIGPCGAVLGVLWNGTACVSISGCSCGGTDCADLFRTEAACRARYAGCLASGGTFECGDRRCASGAEYCNVTNIGPLSRYSCDALPATCARPPTCASCFPRLPPGAGCSDDGAGGLTIDDGRG